MAKAFINIGLNRFNFSQSWKIYNQITGTIQNICITLMCSTVLYTVQYIWYKFQRLHFKCQFFFKAFFSIPLAKSIINNSYGSQSGLGIRSFQKNDPIFAFFSVLYKRTERSLRSFPFFIKERSDLCILFRSL